MNYHTLTSGTMWASQFIRNRRQNSIALLVLHSLQGQKSWFPRPITFSCNLYLLAWFSLAAVRVKMAQVYHKRLLVSSLFPSLALCALIKERSSTHTYSSHRLPLCGKREAFAALANCLIQILNKSPSGLTP